MALTEKSKPRSSAVGLRAKSKPVSVGIEMVTPQKASEWLEKNSSNRTISDGRVAAHARDMVAGDFLLSNDAICFTEDGELLNGQHRLQACAVSGQAFEVVILRGLPRDAQMIMDGQRVRSAADALKLGGHIHTHNLAAAARRLNDLKLIAEDGSIHNRGRLTTKEVMSLLARHPRLIESVKAVSQREGRPHVRAIPLSLAAALHYAGGTLMGEPDKADAFIKVFSLGIPNYPGDPAHRLREKILLSKRSANKLTPNALAYSCIRAWNGLLRKEKITKFPLPRGPVAVEGLDTSLI